MSDKKLLVEFNGGEVPASACLRSVQFDLLEVTSCLLGDRCPSIIFPIGQKKSDTYGC